MEEIENYFNTEYKTAFDRLEYYGDKLMNKPNVDIHSVQHEIREIIDRRFHHKVFIYGEFRIKGDRNTGRTNGKYGWGMLTDIDKQKKVHGLSFDEAFIKLTRNGTTDERKEIVKNIATIKAYLDYMTYLTRQNINSHQRKINAQTLPQIKETIIKPEEKSNIQVSPQISEPLITTLFPINKFLLSDIFSDEAKYKYIMNLLVDKGYCQKETFIWKDGKKGNKGLLAAIIKQLHPQGYYKDNKKPSNEQIQEIAKNTFGCEISISTIEKSNSTTYDVSFIPLAATIK
ncbi:MAG: hypothetical protein ACLQQ4_13015 [Bacteroidia bacterium]